MQRMSWRGNVKKVASLVPSDGKNRALHKFLSADCSSGEIDLNEARSFFDQMLFMKPPPPISWFGALLGGLANSKHMPATIFFYKRLEMYGVLGLRSNLSILNVLLNCYSNMKLGSVGFSAVGVILKNGCRLDVYTFNLLIKGLCLEEKLVEAVDLVSKMLRLGCVPDVITLNTVISALCRTGNVTTALQLLRDMVHGKMITAKESGEPSTYSYSLIDGKCIEWPMVDPRGNNARISPNDSSYNSLIEGLCLSGMDEVAKSLLFEMIDLGAHPYAMSYNMVIALLCKKGKVEEGMEVLKMMILRGKIPSNPVYNTLMGGYCRIGNLKNVMSLYRDMSSKGLLALAAITNILLKGFFRLHKVGDAVSIFENMKQPGVSGGCRPDRGTYSIMIYGLCKHAHIDKAEEIFLEMQKSTISPDVYAYSSLINGICKQGHASKALNLFLDMLAAGISPNEGLYNSLFNGLCLEGLMNKAKELFLQMQRSGVPADASFYNRLLNGFYLSKNVEEANSLLEKMIGDGIVPNAKTFNILCNNVKGSIEQAINLLESVIHSNKLSGLNATDRLIKRICLEGSLDATLKVLSLLESCGYVYDEIIYNILVHEYCKVGMMEDAHELLAEWNPSSPDNVVMLLDSRK